MANLERGHDLMQQAEIEASAGNFGEATTLYTDAISALMQGLKQAENERLTSFQRQKLGSEYLTRSALQHRIHHALNKAERIKRTAPSAPPPPPSAPHVSFQSHARHYTTRIPNNNNFNNYNNFDNNNNNSNNNLYNSKSSSSSSSSSSIPYKQEQDPSSNPSSSNITDDLSMLEFSIPRRKLSRDHNEDPSEMMNIAFQSFNSIMNKKDEISNVKALNEFFETLSTLMDSFEVQSDGLLIQQHIDHVLSCVQHIDRLSKTTSSPFTGLSSRRVDQLTRIVEFLEDEALSSLYGKSFSAAYSNYLKAAECCMLCLKYANHSEENKFKKHIITLMSDAEEINVLFKEQKKFQKSKSSGDHSDRFKDSLRTYCDFVTPAVEAEKNGDAFLAKGQKDRALSMYQQSLKHFEASLKYEQNFGTRVNVLEKKLFLKAKKKNIEQK